MGGGFLASPTLIRDRQFDPLRAEPGLRDLVRRTESRREAALAVFRDAGGPGLLGLPRAES